MLDSPHLELAREALVDLSAGIASRNPAALDRSLRLAARFADHVAVEEVLLQSHLFVGFPIALEAFRRWRGMTPEPASGSATEEANRWGERGEAICRTVYARNYEKLRANVSALHPQVDQWMVVGGYGMVIGRRGLDLPTRELCIVALLAVWNAPRQLHSHLSGALNAGALVADVDAAVEIACRYLDLDRASEVKALWSEIATERAVPTVRV